MLRWVGGFPLLLCAQRLAIGLGLTAQGRLVGADTVFPVARLPARLIVQYSVPPGYGRDTFLLVLRHAVGVVGRLQMLPKFGRSTLEAQITLPRPGVYSAAVYRLRGGSLVWAHKRFYILAPPYVSLAQVRAYHNALLAQKKTSPPLEEVALPADPILEEPLPTPEKVELPPIEVEYNGLEAELLPIDDPNQAPVPEVEDLELNEEP